MRVTNTVARVLAAGAGLLLASAGLAQSPADRRGGPAHHAEAV